MTTQHLDLPSVPYVSAIQAGQPRGWLRTRRLWSNWGVNLSIIMLKALILAILFADVTAPHDTGAMSLRARRHCGIDYAAPVTMAA